MPDHQGEYWAERAKKEQIKVNQDIAWRRPRGPKIPPAVAISRTLAHFNSLALKWEADPPPEVEDPLKDLSPPACCIIQRHPTKCSEIYIDDNGKEKTMQIPSDLGVPSP